ncbi:metal-dependent hydrolase [Haloterrigena salinisoli]|uniref:metal-dependent hydrolase n=1 Tax=Haloterrigena salinisoli TaxID=3132747 RepID=UPI0030CD3E52
MMVTTHVFAGLAVVAPVAYLLPELATPLAVGAVLGGLAPDFDLVFAHRRTFHFPVAGAAVAAPAVGLAVVVPSSATVALAAFAVAAWLHAVSDAVGSGPEMDPWNHRHERAVYDHVRGRWIRPRRWIRYDGAPEDAALATALAVPALLVFGGPIAVVVLVGVALSIVYAALRRRLVAWLPDWLE